MSLNIKNERVHALAKEAARRTGMSQTSVIEQALTRMLEQLREPADSSDKVASAMKIAEEFGRGLSPEQRASLSTERLYDERGLPA